MISASGFISMMGAMSSKYVFNLELCGKMLLAKKNFLPRACASSIPVCNSDNLANSLLRARKL